MLSNEEENETAITNSSQEDEQKNVTIETANNTEPTASIVEKPSHGMEGKTSDLTEETGSGTECIVNDEEFTIDEPVGGRQIDNNIEVGVNDVVITSNEGDVGTLDQTDHTKKDGASGELPTIAEVEQDEQELWHKPESSGEKETNPAIDGISGPEELIMRFKKRLHKKIIDKIDNLFK